MPVDMFERRFRQELAKLPEFSWIGTRAEEVERAGFPAWQAAFTACCLWCHDSGYRLPSYGSFFACYRSALERRSDWETRYSRFFTAPLLAGMQYRTCYWYLSGMADAYLRVCLVEAIEDKMKCGIVLHDPRADWKLKLDVVVILIGQVFVIDAFEGRENKRSAIEAKRDEVEQNRKVNTSESSHWNNLELGNHTRMSLSKTVDKKQVVNRVELYSVAAVNGLLARLYSSAGLDKGYFIGHGFADRSTWSGL